MIFSLYDLISLGVKIIGISSLEADVSTFITSCLSFFEFGYSGTGSGISTCPGVNKTSK